MDMHGSPVSAAAPSPNQPGWHIFPAHCPILAGLVFEPRWTHACRCHATRLQWGQAQSGKVDALLPGRRRRRSWDAPSRISPFPAAGFSSRRGACQEFPSLRPTLLQHCSVLFPTCSGQGQVDLPGSTCWHQQGRVLLPSSCSSSQRSCVHQRQRCLINNKRQFPQTEPGDYSALCVPHLHLTGWEGL